MCCCHRTSEWSEYHVFTRNLLWNHFCSLLCCWNRWATLWLRSKSAGTIWQGELASVPSMVKGLQIWEWCLKMTEILLTRMFLVFLFFLVALFLYKIHIIHIHKLYIIKINHSFSLQPSYSRACFDFFFFFILLIWTMMLFSWKELESQFLLFSHIYVYWQACIKLSWVVPS